MSHALFPYDTLKLPPSFQVAEVRLDGAAEPSVVNQEESSVKLFDAKRKWRRVELDLELTADREAVQEFELIVGGCPRWRWLTACRPTSANPSDWFARNTMPDGGRVRWNWTGTTSAAGQSSVQS